MFRVKSTGNLITLDELKRLHPNTSFPVQLSAAILTEFGVDIVLESPTPQVTELQTYTIDGAVQLNGAWHINYVVKPLFDNKADEDAFLETKRVERIKSEIAALETSVTPRRQREAILSIDNGWLAEQEAKIEALRATL